MSNRLAQLRKEHGFKSQKALADVLFVNQTAVSQWERGVTMPSNQQLVRLSEIFHVTTDYLLGITDVASDSVSSSNSNLSLVSDSLLPLSDIERQLIEDFRSLDSDGRDFILHAMAMTVPVHSGKNKAVSDMEAAL